MKEQTVYALGFFDGVHLGHQALLRECRALADKARCQAGVVTFRTHPAKYLLGEEPPRINTGMDRRQLLFSYGMDIVEERAFTRETVQMPWEEFLGKLLRPAGFVCGSDFRFGCRGEGTAEKLAQWCAQQEAPIPCVIVPQQELHGIRVSSTHIRSLLEQGQMAEAVRFLGHPHRMTGFVVHGKNLGHKLGIPTANMALPEGTVRLPNGVYACTAEVKGKILPAVTNIGTQPTVDGSELTVEPWILDFEGDLYGKKLTLHFYDYLRPEQKFDSVEDLKAEIQKNAAQTRKILEKY